MSFLAPLRPSKSIRIPFSSTSQLHPAYQPSPSTRTPFRIHGHSHWPGTAPIKHRLLSTMSDSRPIFFFDIDNCVRIVDSRIGLASTDNQCSPIALLKKCETRSHPALAEYFIVRPTADRDLRAESNIHDEMQKLIRMSILSSPTSRSSHPCSPAPHSAQMNSSSTTSPSNPKMPTCYT